MHEATHLSRQVEAGFNHRSEDRGGLPASGQRVGIQPLRIEILTAVSGVSFAECWPRREAAIIDSIPVNVIDLGSLRANKQASGRPKDREDLRHLPPSAR